jgi:hypothetical protein
MSYAVRAGMTAAPAAKAGPDPASFRPDSVPSVGARGAGQRTGAASVF